ncbi:LysR substrate-binding domain-containing protein [Ketobacter sp.]|uniref:LysR substrate-binding domain-containing protein n=1 Tax=Ketobacter sp. TaxID=2083498 RepID=UPI000F1D03A4|nr:LysR substrate-binding domain-containing protein [Ketobacter sp.]RLT95350.1 MAG: LysR family transcriptional regulator [Ketobacter sp.]
MAYKGPPLQHLRVFQAAARELSFKRAATELNVTPSAVSHQIKALEEQLQFSLFRRLNRALKLTPAGEELLEALDLHLSQLQRALEHLKRRHGAPSIRAHILPFMATEIVIPRLFEFQQAHPEIELRIETSYRPTDMFALSDCDLGVRFGLGDWPGLVSEKLMTLRVTPVCSAEFQSQHNMQTLADIRGKTLINLPMDPNPWQRLAEEAGLAPLPPHQEITLDNYLSNLTAAEQHLGIALGLLPMAFPMLQKNRLIAPFDVHFTIDESYWVVYRPQDAERPEVQTFKLWLMEIFSSLQNRSDEFYSFEAQKVSFVATSKSH